MNAQPPTGVSFSEESHLASIETSMPMIGLDAMQRANSTLEDFVSHSFFFDLKT